MEHNDVYKQFNKAVKNLMKYLIEIKPKNNETRMMYQFYKFMKALNRKSPHNYFNRLVAGKHTQEILTGDFHYFLSDEFDDPDAQLSSIINSFKKEFASLSDDERQMIWNHLIVLIKYNDDCLKYKLSKLTKLM